MNTSMHVVPERCSASKETELFQTRWRPIATTRLIAFTALVIANHGLNGDMAGFAAVIVVTSMIYSQVSSL